MLDIQKLPPQPREAVSFWNVGSLLYGASLLFVFESWLYYTQLRNAYQQENVWMSLFWMGSVLFAFSHVFLVILDGWSRYQNYKRIKDYLFMHGFTPKIGSLYQGSKCQRTAFLVAARELGLEDEVLRYYQRLGIKSYHFVPHFMIKDPLFLFKRYFWSRTFLEKHYEPKFNYRQLKPQMPLYNAYRNSAE